MNAVNEPAMNSRLTILTRLFWRAEAFNPPWYGKWCSFKITKNKYNKQTTMLDPFLLSFFFKDKSFLSIWHGPHLILLSKIILQCRNLSYLHYYKCQCDFKWVFLTSGRDSGSSVFTLRQTQLVIGSRMAETFSKRDTS